MKHRNSMHLPPARGSFAIRQPIPDGTEDTSSQNKNLSPRTGVG